MFLLNLPLLSESIVPNPITLLILLTVPFLVITSRIFVSRRVFLVGFACCKHPDRLKCSKDLVADIARRFGHAEATLDFMKRTIQKGGLGDSTYLSEAVLNCHLNDLCIEAAREESEMVVFGAIDALLAKTKVRCGEIGILIVNCTVFNVVPSLSDTVVNRYKLRDDVASYNISGRGCSAGLHALGLAKQLFS